MCGCVCVCLINFHCGDVTCASAPGLPCVVTSCFANRLFNICSLLFVTLFCVFRRPLPCFGSLSSSVVVRCLVWVWVSFVADVTVLLATCSFAWRTAERSEERTA